ncbi:MAG TPA: hypothetical protein EYH03_05570 [Chromatiales bacterium]|nr:hypothetical protein [Chromatiales bacterium]
MEFTTLYKRVHRWAEQAAAAGWIDANAVKRLEEVEQQQVEALFNEQQAHRPLIVGFFGGTGVGKSSLLNRLAGEAIARVGVERPTSHEVTLYLHDAFRLQDLPDDLPTAGTRILYHHHPGRRLIAWLDMPDIDSTEQHNRQLVEAWLPYVDWLIYVVSPDRYHDDVGWRFLQQRSHRHAWLFIMNHWDQGRPEQLDDFRRRLEEEGFNEPVVLRSSCLEGEEDDFAELEQTIADAIETYGLDLLQQLGVQARIDDLRKRCADYANEIGPEARWDDAESQWTATVRDGVGRLEQQLGLQIDAVTARLEAKIGAKGWRRLLPGRQTPETLAIEPAEGVEEVWSERMADRFQDLRTELLNRMQAEGLPVKGFSDALEAHRPHQRQTIKQALEDDAVRAMARPGTPIQRGLYRASGVLSWLFPLGAAGWTVFHVVTAFYGATQGERGFLGFDFAIHSALLIGLAWLIPWIVHARLRPSPAASLRRGMRKGAAAGSDRLIEDHAGVWAEVRAQRDHQMAGLDQVVETLQGLESGSLEELGGLVSQRKG